MKSETDIKASIDKVFKAYDVRGLFPGEWDADIARLTGNAFVRYLNAESIVIGRDMRTSSPVLAKAFCEGELGVQSDTSVACNCGCIR